MPHFNRVGPEVVTHTRALSSLRQLNMFISRSFQTADPGTRYAHNWHIDLLAEYLEAAGRGEVRRLIINMPPRALKSICVSVAWPAWLLGHDPTRRIICASYALPLALKHSLDCRHVMTSAWYRELFPHVQLARDQNEKHKFTTTSRGYRYTASVGGALTGEGGNTLIIDDPQTPMQAASRTGRETVNQWFEGTFASRLDDRNKGAIVLVMQRLHADDLSGHLLERGGWEHLCLPATAPETMTYDFGGVRHVRKAGEPLHEERLDAQALEQARKEMGSYAYAAQYQQTPLPEEGNVVRAEWFRRYEAPPPETSIVQSWDTAIKSGEEHDASACLTFSEHEGRAYLLEALVVRMEYPHLKRLVRSQAEKWRPRVVLMEDKSSGQQLLQDLRCESRLPLVPMLPMGDKSARMQAVSGMLESGKLLLPGRAEWLAAFEAELLHFPNGRHDDQVDALTQYLQWMRQHNGGVPNCRVL